METLETFIRFFGSYPMWARLVVLGCITASVVTLVIAPRPANTQPGKDQTGETSVPAKSKQVFMRVMPIKMFPENQSAEVQLSIFVNGTEFIHPSVAGIKWMKVGPAMSEKIIELPPSSRFDVRIEMRVRNGPTLATRQMVSQQTTPVKSLPYTEEYKLYDANNGTRSASVAAIVTYEIYAQ